MSPRLQFAINAAQSAGRATLKHFMTAIAIERKTDDSPVTIADQEAEQIIRDLINRAYPNDSILGEEFGESSGTGGRWTIDPIDGTKSFVCGVPLYATLLAYSEDSDPLLGVAYFPALDELIFAEVGGGTFFNGHQVHVKQSESFSGATICTGGPANWGKLNLTEKLMQISEQTQAVRTWCDAYGHCLVATGRVDAMIDLVVHEWDTAALRPIISEAGGIITDLSGAAPLTSAISAPPLLHANLLEILGG